MNATVFHSLRTRLHRLLPSKAGAEDVLARAEFNPQGTIVAASPAFERLLGYTQGGLRGRGHRQLLETEPGGDDQHASMLQAMAAGRTLQGVFPRRRADGSRVWLQTSYHPIRDPSGQLTRIVKLAMDATEQQSQMVDMESRLKAIDRAQGVIEFALDGTILAANPVFLDIIGYRLDEVVGRHHRMLMDPAEMTAPAYQAFWERLRAGHYTSSLFRRIGRDGREVWIQASYNPVFSADGRPWKVIKYATDVTSQTQAARLLQKEVVQLSYTVRDNARLAAQATEISRQTQQRLDDGRQIVDELIGAMKALRERMSSISGIMDMIDAITLRTRLLSLNARVEAAHAGQAGSGFAVVATEINALAAQCKAAASDIHQLLQDAAECMVQGEQQTGAADEAMQRMAETVHEVSRSTQSIHQAAALQEGGIQRVHAAVSELERASRQ